VDSKLLCYEKNERYLADKLFSSINTIEEYSFSSGKVCYDFIVKLKSGIKILGEIKVRNFKIDKYDDYILEVDKLVRLINVMKKYNFDRIYYINFFETDYEIAKDFIIFNLTERLKEWKVNKPKIEKRLMNYETYKSTDVKVFKDVIMLKYIDNIDARGIIMLT